jgi:hypothetical protein
VVASFPAEAVDREVVRGEVEDRHAVGVDGDACSSRVLAVENDGVAVDASDRDVVLVARDDVPARIRAAVDEDRVARIGARDGFGNRGRVLGDADRRLRASACETERREPEYDDAGDAPNGYAFASSSSFFVSEMTFCAMCAGTSS